LAVLVAAMGCGKVTPADPGGGGGAGGHAAGGSGGTVATGGSGGNTGTTDASVADAGIDLPRDVSLAADTGVDTGRDAGSSCVPGKCPPLAIADLTAIDATNASGFANAGFRCKSLTLCPAGTACLYYSTDMFGSVQSGEMTYTDGIELPDTPKPVELRIDTGAASQCGNPAITLKASDSITIVFDASRRLSVALPDFSGTSLTLYVASDGSTFYDAALTMPARLRG